METIRFGDKSISLFENGGDCVFIPTDAGSGARIFELLKAPCTLAVIEGVEWNRELSPWAADAVFRNGGDFGGGGEVFLGELTGAVRARSGALLYCGIFACRAFCALESHQDRYFRRRRERLGFALVRWVLRLFRERGVKRRDDLFLARRPGEKRAGRAARKGRELYPARL